MSHGSLFGMLFKERLDLAQKSCFVKTRRIDFYFIEVNRSGEFVLADKVDFILALSIPPGTYRRT